MQKFYEIDDLVPKLDRQMVLKTMDCYEDNPVYEEMVDEYEAIKDDMLALAKPVGVLGFGVLPKEIETEEYKEGTPVIYAVTSIGGEISRQSTLAFQEGDYVKGLLCDSMGDNILFSLEDRVMEKLQELCKDLNVGIEKRLEAPYQIPMEAQRIAWDYLKLQDRFGIGISCGYMFDPVKTSCQIYVLTEEKNLFKAHHDCRTCPNVNCKLRNIPEVQVTVQKEAKEQIVSLKDRESLLDGLIRAGFYMSSPCGGTGRCGKCKIRVTDGTVEISREDRKIFTEEELQAGYRLACKVYPTENIKVLFEANDESVFEILSDGANNAEKSESNRQSLEDDTYEIAVDIGTTTIAMALIGKGTGTVREVYTCINSQRAYGADVISRIQASIDGKKEILQASVRKELCKGVKTLLEKSSANAEQLLRICISGNTIMGHLLMGYPCDTLGMYPFDPYNIDFIKGTSEDILGESGIAAEVILLPGISTYVGGDIVSGIYSCGMDQTEEVSMLIDLGTNGEMAIGNCEKIFVTSTAAGPAFEGGNITWGTGSIAGAICSVEIHDEKAEVKTIQNQKPAGICGTGVVESVTELVKEEIVDETGRMDDAYFEDGFPLAQTEDGQTITFTRKDVREIQLAKAAIRAGAETLMLRYGVPKEQISKVYLAGGFGYKLDIEKAIFIGMLPEEFRGRIEAVGNSSLAGAQAFLKAADGKQALQHIVEISKEINLSSDRDFNEFYMDYMMFETDDY